MCFVPEIVSCHVKLLLRHLLMSHLAVTCLMQSLHHGQTYFCPHDTKAKNMAVVLTTSAQKDTWDTIRCCWSSIHKATFGDTWVVATLGYSYISLEVAKNKLCSLQSSSIAVQCKQGLNKWQPWAAMPRPPCLPPLSCTSHNAGNVPEVKQPD
jgi:hypothetical protein